MSEAIADSAGPTRSERRPDGQFIRCTITDARYS
jgi:hypothetical protein